MKLKLTGLILLFSLMINGFAQTPNLINYQAVVRNLSGALVANQVVGVKISILQGSTSGPAVFSETHTPTSNAYGIINLQIGNGTNFGPQLNTIDWGAHIYFIKVEIDPSGGSTYMLATTSQLVSVPYALFAKDVENNDDADADPANEYNTGAVLNGTDLEITDGGGTFTVSLASLEDDADPNPTNEIQTITKVGNIITLSLGGGAVTDDVNDADANPANELNTGISLVGSTLSVTDAGGTQSVSLAPLTAGFDNSTTNELNTSASLVGTTLNITDAGGTISVNLASLGNDADASTTNELNTGVSLVGTTLNITDAGGTISVNLVSLEDDADANPANEFNTSISFVGTTLTITDGGGNQSVNLSSLLNDADSNPTNEIQTLSLVGNNLSISGGNSVTLSGTDSQTLSVVGSNLTISGGNTVALPGGTDSQTLSVVGSDLTISGGNTVTLPTSTDTDDQTLSISGNDLTIQDGNTVTLPLPTHYVGEHFGGGIVVWVDSTGQHGLIVAYSNAGNFAFEALPNSGSTVATSNYDGQANTSALVALGPGEYLAAEAADNYAGGGHTDWYLPSIYELEYILEQAFVLGQYALSNPTGATFYWSSTQNSTSAGLNAFRGVNSTGTAMSSTSETTSCAVRCVRKF